MGTNISSRPKMMYVHFMISDFIFVSIEVDNF